MSQDPAIRVENVHHWFDVPGRTDLKVLADVELDIAPGEFIAVMGPSGCGKSTLLNMMAGFEKPRDGAVVYLGNKITGPSPERGLLFQKPALYPWMSVLGNVMFGPRATGVDKTPARDEAMALLQEVGLEGYESYRTYELSGGMQHRVALARTLAGKPDILLMDEPFGALDAQTRVEMQTFLLDIWQRHKSTVVFVTHDIEEGLLLADRALVLGAKPARVLSVLDIPIPRPREASTVLTPEFVELRGHVRDLISESRREGKTND